MSGLLTKERYRELVPESTLTDGALIGYLAAAQAIAENLTGLVFGAEITAVESVGGTVYKLTVGSPLGEPGAKVRLIGGGVSATPFEIVDAGRSWITVNSSVAITTQTTRALPIFEHIGAPVSGEIYCPRRPLFAVVNVQTRLSTDSLWSGSDGVTTLNANQYEAFSGRLGTKTGIRLTQGAIPRVRMGGEFLIKRMAEVPGDCVKVTYAAGYYAVVPADLEMAAVEVANAIAASVDSSGVFASENIDYYSYTRLTYDQMAAVPSSALATFARYKKY